MPKFRVIEGGRSRARRFEALIREHYDALFRAAWRMARSVPDAEDRVQEVCIRALPRIEELEELEDPRGWLMLVLRRLFIDQTRRYDRAHVERMGSEDEFASGDRGPAEEVAREHRTEWLDRAWRRIDAESRSLLTLHDLEGYSLAEIQKITGVKTGTLKSRLHRARVRLGRILRADAAGQESLPASENRNG